MSKKDIAKERVDDLDYGTVVSLDVFGEWFSLIRVEDLDLEAMTLSELRNAIQTEELAFLSAYGAMNEELLKLGRCLVRNGQSYRVLLPSENKERADKYFNDARNKAKKGEQLLRNTPSRYMEKDNSASRLMIMQDRAKRRGKDKDKDKDKPE